MFGDPVSNFYEVVFMKSLGKFGKFGVLLFLLAALAALASGQTQAPSINTSQLILPVSTQLAPVTSAAVTVVGNPGPATYYYWIVANYTVGATSPTGPFVAQQGSPNTLSGTNYDQIIPSYPLEPRSTSCAPLRPFRRLGHVIARWRRQSLPAPSMINLQVLTPTRSIRSSRRTSA